MPDVCKTYQFSLCYVRVKHFSTCSPNKTVIQKESQRKSQRKNQRHSIDAVAARFVTTTRFVTKEVVTNRAGIAPSFFHLYISTCDIVSVTCVCVCARARKEREKERETEID